MYYNISLGEMLFAVRTSPLIPGLVCLFLDRWIWMDGMLQTIVQGRWIDLFSPIL